MNPYLISGLVLLLLLVVWVIAAERYYKMGYHHAIEDLENLSLALKHEIEKRQKNEE